MNINQMFNTERFMRLLLIEIRNFWKKVALATGMVFAFLLFVYTEISDAGNVFNDGGFVALTFIAGAIFTSVIFNDMHHPLERFQYMTLPCSQLERFASKYALTFPLFLLYALAVMAIFKLTAPVLVTLSGRTGAPFEPFEEFPAGVLLMIYLTGHILFFTGAIVFKNFAVVKTGFCLFILPYTFFFAGVISLKIFYFGYFDSFWSIQPTREILPGIQVQLLLMEWLLLSVWCLVYLWLGYVAYTCLKDHEV